MVSVCKSIRILALSVCLLAAAIFQAGAQNDTTYYVKPEGDWHFRLRSDFFRSDALVGVPYRSQYAFVNATTGSRFKQCIGAGWKDLFLNVGFNPFDNKKDPELIINSYGNKIGFNFVAGFSNSMKGNIGVGNLGSDIEHTPFDEGGLLNIYARAKLYYVFNWKRFSFSAAMNQNRIQKRSAGSPIITAKAYMVNMYPQANPSDHFSLNDGFVSFAFGLGGGYAYNWVPVDKLLIHASFTAEYGFLNRTTFITSLDDTNHVRSNTVFMFSGNLSAVYYFGRVYLGAFASSDSLLSVNFSDKEDNTDFIITNRKRDAHVAVGIRF